MGVFLQRMAIQRLHRCLPHARGGVSLSAVTAIPETRSSPRPWGCFFSPLFSRCCL
ncbi:conserved hypothetical protein [methanotrophic bacterial endosymbiont of Bathymodiolus sp.]|nr:conserved hypothetical protein [methanotrophic bacterial endosymbiont of Bathymodiolus sp.]